MKVEKYTRIVNGKEVKCKGYTKKVRYMVFFRTLGEYERFKLLFEDPESKYELVDIYQKNYFKLNGRLVRENRYLDRLLVVSEKEDRELLIQILGLRALKKQERQKRDVRGGWLAYEAI